MKLGVNIDHVATLREARYRSMGGRTDRHAEPDLLEVCRLVKRAGAHGITMHLREDRRHVQDEDVWRVKHWGGLPLNLEMSVNGSIITLALKVHPVEVCLVPERRQEVTTEGGLDVVRDKGRIGACVKRLHRKKIAVSLFVAPEAEQIRACAEVGADYVELHTGAFAEARTGSNRRRQVDRLCEAANLAHDLGLGVNAGHGLRTANLKPIVRIPHIETLNVGHSIVSRALVLGIRGAISEMLVAMERGRA